MFLKRYTSQITLVIVLICGIAIAEAALRLIPGRENTYSVWYVPAFNEKQFKLQFLQLYEDKAPTEENYDPSLGWDTKDAIRGAGESASASSPKAKKILFIGDSFTFGNEVDDDLTFAYLIGKTLPDVQTINMGVPGYGIGQAMLKLEEKGVLHEPDIIVFGIHPPNVQRAQLSFYAAAKPQFVYDENATKMSIRGRPVPPPQEQLASVRRDFQFESSVLAIIINVAVTRIPWIADWFREKTLLEYARVSEAVLRRVQSIANSRGIQFIIVQIPDGKTFQDTSTRNQLADQYPIPSLLLSVYKKLGIPYIDMDEVFLQKLGMENTFLHAYTHPTPGGVGHLSVKGNEIVSKVLMDEICSRFTVIESCKK